MSIIQSVPWTVQPQYPATVSKLLNLATLLSPVGGAVGQFLTVLGPAWTYNGTLTNTLSSFGKSLTTTTGYLSRTSPYNSGAVTVGILFTPSSISGDEGLWSLAGTNVSGGPHFLIQRNGANLRILWGGGYRITVTGCFAVGKQISIVASFSDISLSAGINCVGTIGINGVVYTATAVQDTAATTNEYFMSGFNGQPDGAYGEFWSTPRDFGAQVGNISANQWAWIYAPQTRRIWVPGAVGGGSTGTLATTNANDTSAASGTTTVTGTVAKTNSNDTSAASGTTTVTGTLAKTNANDTVSASGTTTVVGTSATTNANDTSAASGSVGSSGSSGTVAYTNANDTVAASGTTTVTGTVARTNASDTVVAAGWAGTITGTVAYTNANDTSSASGSGGAVAVSFSTGGGIIPQRRRTKEEIDDDRRRLGILPPEIQTGIVDVQHEPRKTITLEHLIGKPRASIGRVDLTQADAAHRKRKRRQDDELLMLM